ncbi:MAG: hypothetical protein V1928_00925 [Parcubacteria group bacterium]
MLKKPLDDKDENYADYIFDLFILCLSWQWDPSYYNDMWTTMDRVKLVLRKLGVITYKQRYSLHFNKEVQNKFLLHVARPVLDYSIGNAEYVWDGVNTTYKQRQIILDSPKRLAITISLQYKIRPDQLLKSYKIHLTKRGNKYAASIAKKYAGIIDSGQYLAELRRLSEKVSRIKPEDDCEIEEPTEDIAAEETPDKEREEDEQEEKQFKKRAEKGPTAEDLAESERFERLLEQKKMKM